MLQKEPRILFKKRQRKQDAVQENEQMEIIARDANMLRINAATV